MSFDWKTEESDWEKPTRRTVEPAVAADELYAGLGPVEETTESGPEAAHTRRRTTLFLFITLILMAAVGGIIFRQVERRASEGRERAEADVLASHELVRSAAEQGDTELFAGVLSGRDPQWAAAQTTLVGNKILITRSQFGFFPHHSGNPDAAPPVIILSPDLNSAELSTLETYELSIGSALTETVTLSQTVVYRRGPDRWLLSPPEPEYWGESMTIDGRHIRITHPERDRAIAQRLARDLEAVMADLCADLFDGCPRVELSLSTNPATLIGSSGNQRLSGTLQVALPAPSLFGIPTDEVAYRALSREYAAQVATTVARNYAGDCCPNDPFFVVLNEAMLHRLGLRSRAVTPSGQLESILNDPNPLGRVNSLWRNGGDTHEAANLQTLYAFIDFMVERASSIPIVEMQRLLAEQRVGAMWDWISDVTWHRYVSPLEFERDWLHYAASQLPSATAGNGELPEQDLQLICRAPGSVDTYLYRYDVGDVKLDRQQKLAAFEEPILAPVPNRDGVVIFGRKHDGLNNLPYLWRGGDVVPLSFDEGELTNLYPLPVQAGYQEMVFFQDDGSTVPHFFTLSYDRCRGDTSCMAEWVVGLPVLSPDRESALFVLGSPTPLTQGPFEPLIYLGDREAENLHIIGYGRSPFWLDNDTIGYVSNPFRHTGQEIVLRDVAPIELSLQEPGGSRIVTGKTLITAADLAGGKSGAALLIDRVIRDLQGENLFIFTATAAGSQDPGQMVVYNLQKEELETRLEFSDEPADYLRSYAFSPDGRWLVVSSLRSTPEIDTAVNWSVYIHATDGSVTHEYVLQSDDDRPAEWLVDWSPDGRWLALATGGYVRLIAPDEGISFPFIFEDRDCTSAAWVNEG